MQLYVASNLTESMEVIQNYGKLHLSLCPVSAGDTSTTMAHDDKRISKVTLWLWRMGTAVSM